LIDAFLILLVTRGFQKKKRNLQLIVKKKKATLITGKLKMVLTSRCILMLLLKYPSFGYYLLDGYFLCIYNLNRK
jgi:hypothetical protein